MDPSRNEQNQDEAELNIPVEEDIYSGVTDEEEPADEQEEQEEEGGEEQEEQGEQQEEQQEQAGAPGHKPTEGGLSSEAAKAIGAEIARNMQSQKGGEQQEQKKLTPEERDKLLRRVHVTGDLMTKLGFQEPNEDQIVAFQQLMDGVAQHAYTMAEARVRMAENSFKSEMTPIQEVYRTYQQQQAEQIFYSKYPALQKFPKAVQEAAKVVQATDANGQTKPDHQLIEEVAANAIEFIKQFNPDFDLSQATPSAPDKKQKTGAGVPAMASTMSGGRSQGGTGAATASDNNPDADIYS